ncbi:MAG: type II toxin-antitoxin system ParD family antitoxin [Rhizobium sp.]|jgi:antitoxin ParD1/3/4|nr:type II toxin-antitoxin system ParD family antitoxin [Rhizobium sp.]MCZ8349635.1 type II toxin-antitoxin system ParD family antitoxin [Rhizobium sp.]
MNVSLDDRWEKFVEETVRTGRFGSASEVILEGLRLVEQREMKISGLRKELADAIAAGGELNDDAVTEALEEEAALLKRQGY